MPVRFDWDMSGDSVFVFDVVAGYRLDRYIRSYGRSDEDASADVSRKPFWRSVYLVDEAITVAGDVMDFTCKRLVSQSSFLSCLFTLSTNTLAD